MNFFAFLLHLGGFVAPAVVVAGLLWLASKATRAGRVARWSPSRDLWVLLAAGVAVLLAGLVFFGRDGKVATYAALVVVQGTLAWGMRRR